MVSGVGLGVLGLKLRCWSSYRWPSSMATSALTKGSSGDKDGTSNNNKKNDPRVVMVGGDGGVPAQIKMKNK